jgi:hypothetical protein
MHGSSAIGGGWLGTIPSKWMSYLDESSSQHRRILGPPGFRVLRANSHEAVGSVAAWLIENVSVYEVLGRLAGRAVDREVHRLHPSDKRRLGKADHRICSLLEEMAEALNHQLSELAEQTPSAIAKAVFPLRRGHSRTEEVHVKVMRAALKTIIKKAIELTGVTQLEMVVRALRIGALFSCPDLSEHESLERTCAAPLANEMAKDEITGALQKAAGRKVAASGI